MSERVEVKCRYCGGESASPGDGLCEDCAWYDPEDDLLPCECNGSGWIITCFDDLCCEAK